MGQKRAGSIYCLPIFKNNTRVLVQSIKKLCHKEALPYGRATKWGGEQHRTYNRVDITLVDVILVQWHKRCVAAATLVLAAGIAVPAGAGLAAIALLGGLLPAALNLPTLLFHRTVVLPTASILLFHGCKF